MADNSIDVLMRVVGPKGPFAAESNAVFKDATTQQLRENLQPGFFCELREFNFEAGVAAALNAGDKEARMSESQKADKAKKRREKQENYATMTLADKRQAEEDLLKKRHQKALDKRGSGDFVDMQPVEFTRVMDAMSMPLFEAFAGCETLKEVNVAKRKAAGTTNSGEIYLRLDFEQVLITDLGWKDSEHLILETGSFIYRRVIIRYRPQLASGALGPVVRAEWEMAKAMPAATTGGAAAAVRQ